MVTIGRMPRKVKSFFAPVREEFSNRAWRHFWGLVLAMTASHGCTVDRLTRLLRHATHRTNQGEFLWRSAWEESRVLTRMACRTLRRVSRGAKRTEPCYLIIDDTQTLKRAKKMDGVGKLYHHASGTYGTGHTILKVCLLYRGVIIPWGSWLYVKHEDAPALDLPFHKLTELAAQAVRQAELPPWLRVIVLFDAYYLCPTVARACTERGWHYVSVGKANRRFTVQGRAHRLDAYGAGVLRRCGRRYAIRGLKATQRYRLAERVGHLKKLGTVKVVFSRRPCERRLIALVTDAVHMPMKTVVAHYLKRWAIELLIKEEKQHLGLGDYRVLRYRAVVRHLHLVDCAYACLTHLALTEPRAQGHPTHNDVPPVPPISQLKVRMKHAIWRETIEDVVKHAHEKPVIRRLEKLLAA